MVDSDSRNSYLYLNGNLRLRESFLGRVSLMYLLTPKSLDYKKNWKRVMNRQAP